MDFHHIIIKPSDGSGAVIIWEAILCEHLPMAGRVALIEHLVTGDQVVRPCAWAARSVAEAGADLAQRVPG